MLVKYIPHQLIITNFLLKWHLSIDGAITIIIIIIIIVVVVVVFLVVVATSQFYIVFCILSANAHSICRFESQSCINLFMWGHYKSKLFWTYSISRKET